LESCSHHHTIFSGQYIPHIATHLLDDKQNKHSIRGLIIGNGWFSARDQYPAYLDYLIDEKLVKKGSAGAKTIKDAIEKCVEAMGQEGKGSIILPVCELILSAITEVTKKE
jgi:carboxypeptidase C (cathepsin A)